VAWDLPALIELVDSAKTRVRLQALTYKAGDWTELEDALVRAAKRGVAVELLLADWAKAAKTIGGLQQLARTPGISIKLVTIPAWSGGFIPYARVIHAKLVVADGQRGWVGTSNFERDYFYESRNVGMLVEGWFASQLDDFFERTWKSPYAVAIDPDATYTAPKTH
jgi:phosphatidylserine/phosphatidylglycerophosphate/cardiolipin synthase-like enzyme